MYYSSNYPPIQVMNQQPGQDPVYSQLDGGYKTISRSDTIRRKKPSVSDVTSVSTYVTDLRHAKLISNPFPGRVIQTSTASTGYFGRPPTQDLQTLARIVAENKLRAEAKQSGVNLANMMGEYRQTATLYGELSKAGVNLYRSVRRGNWRGVLSSYNRSKDWLLFMYGIKPLMGDLYDAIEEMKEAKITPPTVKSSSTQRWSDKQKIDVGNNTYVVNRFSEYRVKCGARVQVNDSFFRSFAAQHGLTNPAALVWELTPFSFVIDWWINVGDTLASLDNCLVFSSLTGYSSFKTDEIVDCAGGYFRYQENFRQTKDFSLTDELHYKPSVSLTHILNGLALWRSIR